MKRDPVTGHFLPSNKRSAAMRTAASSIGRILRGNPSPVAFNVYLGSRLIDTVHYSAGSKVTVAQVRRSLIEHDGYDPRIRVTKARTNPSRPKKRTARKASPKRRSVKRAPRKPSRAKRRSAR